MRLGLDGRTVAIGVFAVILALVLGGTAGTAVGASAGAWTALAGLLPPAVLAVAVELRARNARRVQRRQELLSLFAPPEPAEGAEAEEEDALAGLQVSRYLRPENRVVSFLNRPELNELVEWCVSGGHAGIRLVTGPAGAGKTRLALRLGEELDASGWQPLWVSRGSELDAVTAVQEIGQPCVLIVDYAETRSELVGLLNSAAAEQDGPDLRILLLARSAGEWWQQLLASAEERVAALIAAAEPIPLGPVHAAGGPQQVFDDALTAFAKTLSLPRPNAVLALGVC